MSGRILDYHGVVNSGATPLRTAVWITLLVLGFFDLTGGLCIGPMWAALPTGGPTTAVSESRRVMGAAWCLVVFAGLLLSGLTYVRTSARIRRRSRKAATFAFTVTLVNWALIASAVSIEVAGLLNHLWRISWRGIVLHGGAVVINALVTWMLYGILREHRSGGVT